MNTNQGVYILAFGPHPDDVEIGAGGLLAKACAQGKHCMIIDLTCSHLSTHGTPELRLQESQDAANILGAQRLNLGLDDLHLVADSAHRDIIARYIRQYRPEIVVFPYYIDRHPDHVTTSMIVQQALFAAGVAKIDMQGLAPHRPRVAAMYQIRGDNDPNLIITLSEDDYRTKEQAFWSYSSQQETNHRAKEYFDGRSKVLGWKVGAHYGEGYIMYESQVGISSFDTIHVKPL